jgi:hypothetical protein
MTYEECELIRKEFRSKRHDLFKNNQRILIMPSEIRDLELDFELIKKSKTSMGNKGALDFLDIPDENLGLFLVYEDGSFSPLNPEEELQKAQD